MIDGFLEIQTKRGSYRRAHSFQSTPSLLDTMVISLTDREKVRVIITGLERRLGSEGTPVGRYSIAALKALGVTPPAQTIYGSNVRDVVSKVAEGAAEAGIVYATDVAVDPRVETAFELPAAAQPKVVYPVALLTERGRKLSDAFRAPAALEMALRRGFRGP